jgi:heme oxygenase
VEALEQGLGCLHVLKGSTLGARFIAKHIENELHLATGSGAAFFNAYGESTSERWNSFRSFVIANVTVEGREEVRTAARPANLKLAHLQLR